MNSHRTYPSNTKELARYITGELILATHGHVKRYGSDFLVDYEALQEWLKEEIVPETQGGLIKIGWAYGDCGTHISRERDGVEFYKYINDSYGHYQFCTLRVLWLWNGEGEGRQLVATFTIIKHKMKMLQEKARK